MGRCCCLLVFKILGLRKVICPCNFFSRKTWDEALLLSEVSNKSSEISVYPEPTSFENVKVALSDLVHPG